MQILQKAKIITPLIAGTLAFTGSGSANALPTPLDNTSPISQHQLQEISPELLEQARLDLLTAGVPHQLSDDGLSMIFTFEEGISMALPLGATNQSSLSNLERYASPSLRGGRQPGGFWLEFTPTEQNNLLGGGTALLTAAICAIPGLGWAACTVIGLTLTQTTLYISNVGCGSQGRNLRVDVAFSGVVQGGRCV